MDQKSDNKPKKGSSSSSTKGKNKLSSSYTDSNDFPSDEDEDEDGDRISDGDQQVQRYPNKRGPEVKPVDVVLSDKEFKKRGKR
jgi:hypothetical protein